MRRGYWAAVVAGGGGFADATVREKIRSVVDYLRTLQAPAR